jgi:hypothetical protein
MLFLTTQLTVQRIIGAKHDFSISGWDWIYMHGGINEICKSCYTPHSADNTVIEDPLWNHQVKVAVFTHCTSTTLNATNGWFNNS